MLKKPDKDFILPEAVEGCLWKGKVGITGTYLLLYNSTCITAFDQL